MKVERYRNLSEAVEKLKTRGFEGDFVVEHDKLRHTITNERFSPEDLRIVEHYRFEGPSNPDDMAVLYLLESRNGIRGTVVDAFGTYSNPELGEILERMEKTKAGS